MINVTRFQKSEMAEQGNLSFKQTGDATLEVHLLAIGNPVALLASAELRETRGFAIHRA